MHWIFCNSSAPFGCLAQPGSTATGAPSLSRAHRSLQQNPPSYFKSFDRNTRFLTSDNRSKSVSYHLQQTKKNNKPPHPHQSSFTPAAGYKEQGQRKYKAIINSFPCPSWPMAWVSIFQRTEALVCSLKGPK